MKLVCILCFTLNLIKARILFPTEEPLAQFEQHFGRCVTPKGEEGECVYLHDCEILYTFFTKVQISEVNNVLYLRRSHCGYYNGTVLVCCPRTVRPSSYNSELAADIVPRTKKRDALLPQPGVCGTGDFHRIYGGERTKIDEFPWMALLEYTKPDNRKGYHCGGVLINEKFVLTASHCVIGKEIPATWKLSGVRLGEWDTTSNRDCEFDYCSDPVEDILIERAITHEQYNPHSRNQHHDIALLRLLKRVQYTNWIKPICLPLAANLRNLSFEGVPLYVSGWGKTEQGVVSNFKLKAQINGVSLKTCKAAYRKHNILIKNTQVCAGGMEGVDSCRGDSGGPLIGFYNSNKTQPYYFLVGVVSFGTTTCGLKGWPGVYTKISPYLEWIESHIF